MVKSYSRGHPILFVGGVWVYEDNNEPLSENRTCKRCGKSPTVEGYDTCLGYIANAISACCGHGVENGYVIYQKENRK